MNKQKIYRTFLLSIGILLSVIFAGVSPAFAHPGRTDGAGCHTCRTNCPNWGLSTGEYHCHDAKATPQPKAPVKSTYGENGTGYVSPAPEYASPKPAVTPPKVVIPASVPPTPSPVVQPAAPAPVSLAPAVNSVKPKPAVVEPQPVSMTKAVQKSIPSATVMEEVEIEKEAEEAVANKERRGIWRWLFGR